MTTQPTPLPELEYTTGERATRIWANPIILRRGETMPLLIQNGNDRDDSDICRRMVRLVNSHAAMVACLRGYIALLEDTIITTCGGDSLPGLGDALQFARETLASVEEQR